MLDSRQCILIILMWAVSYEKIPRDQCGTVEDCSLMLLRCLSWTVFICKQEWLQLSDLVQTPIHTQIHMSMSKGSFPYIGVLFVFVIRRVTGKLKPYKANRFLQNFSGFLISFLLHLPFHRQFIFNILGHVTRFTCI